MRVNAGDLLQMSVLRRRTQEPSPLNRFITGLVRTLALVMFPVAMQVPAVALPIASSHSLLTGRFAVLARVRQPRPGAEHCAQVPGRAARARHPAGCAAARMPALHRPQVPSESATPLRDMAHVAGEQWAAFWADVREKNGLSRRAE